MTFSSGQCVLPQTIGTCTDGQTTKEPQHLSDPAAFDAFSVLVAIECSTLGRTPLMDFTGTSLDVTKEWGAAREFLSGAASGNPSIADITGSSILGAASSATGALACLEQTIANTLAGRLGFVHVAPALATILFADGSIYRDGRLWFTASGNLVVISPGYDGREPGADTPLQGESMWMYATGEVYAATGQRDTLDATERSQNTSVSIAEDVALVAFDPCFAVAIDTGEVFCDVVS